MIMTIILHNQHSPGVVFVRHSTQAFRLDKPILLNRVSENAKEIYSAKNSLPLKKLPKNIAKVICADTQMIFLYDKILYTIFNIKDRKKYFISRLKRCAKRSAVKNFFLLIKMKIVLVSKKLLYCQVFETLI